MKKSLFVAAIAVFALGSCSKDQVVDIPQNEIKFSVVTENATKAANVFCSYNYMESFTVYAQNEDGEGYITNGDLIKYTGSAWENQTATRYWPETDGASLDFYAIVNGDLTFTPDGTPIAKVESFTPATEVANQVDLMYAVAVDQTKDNGAVEMNFRHALSQIEFRAKNLNPTLYVEIKNVKVGKVYATGSYVLTDESTAANFEDHTQVSNATTLTRGDWTFGSTYADYVVAVYPTDDNITNSTDAAAVPYNETEVVSLTLSTDTDDTRDFSKSMLLLPTVNSTNAEGLAKWTGAAPSSGVYDGSYLGIECVFYNVADPDKAADADNIVKIKETWAYLPVDIKWEEGKKYIYTFIFDDGQNGGFEPDGEEVFTPITFTVTVDDFEKGANEDVNVNVQ